MPVARSTPRGAMSIRRPHYGYTAMRTSVRSGPRPPGTRPLRLLAGSFLTFRPAFQLELLLHVGGVRIEVAYHLFQQTARCPATPGSAFVEIDAVEQVSESPDECG